jgi:hypothetical protein
VITIVSGLPRSGTSLMMQMLAAGGMPILSDSERQADVDNPRGYLEWERIKQLPKDPACIAEAEGKVDHKDYVKTLRIPYHEALRDAEGVGQKRSDFLEIGLNLEALGRQVDATLYRNRSR